MPEAITRQSEAEREVLTSLMARFEKSRSPIEVNFRELMPASTDATRHGHGIHPYPAKLLVNIPQFFLAALAKRAGDQLLDPFCGSGTVLFEGTIANLRSAGSDSNPLARLITTAKLTPIDREIARTELARIMSTLGNLHPSIPDVVNRSYWFSDRICDALGRLRSAIKLSVSPDHRPLFDVAFSWTVRRVSFADPRLSVPVKINPERSARYGAKGDEVIRRLKRLDEIDVAAVFWGIANQNIRKSVQRVAAERQHRIRLFNDARRIGLPDASVDLAITSPPYVGAQKYIRASSLSLGWLGLTPDCKLRPLECQSIGREHLSSSEALVTDGTGIAGADLLIERIADRNVMRARIAQRYLLEMRQALVELARTMKHDASLILVVGPNLVSGFEFPTPQYLNDLAEEAGFSTQLHLVDSIESRGLMTKRNRTAGLIQQESVLLLKRMRSDV